MVISNRQSIALPILGITAVGSALFAFGNIAAGIVFGCVLGSLLLLFPGWTVSLLVVAAALTRVGIQSGDAQARVDLLVIAVVAAVVANRVAVRTISLRALKSPLLVPACAYAACNLFSTLFFATEKSRGLKLDAQIVAVVLALVVLAAVLRDESAWRRALRALWIVTVGEALFGLVLVALYVGGLSTAGVQLGDYGLPMAYGTSYEANIYGSFLAGNFFFLLADYALARRSAWHALGLVTVVLGIAASETRTAWLGLVLGLLLFSALMLRARGTGARLVPVLAAIPVVVLLAGILGATTPLAGRILAIANLHSSSAVGRLVIFQAALSDWRQHLMFGMGTGSFSFGAGPGQPHPWLPNLFLLTLHDTGIVGLATLLWLILAFYVAALRAYRMGGTPATCAMGAIPGFTALLVAFQTTSGFWFLYPWIVASAGALADRFKSESP